MAKRSIVGTIIFILLAQVHFISLFQVLDLLFDFYYIDWVNFSAQLLQSMTFVLYIYLLIKPVIDPLHRLVVSFYFS